MIGVILDQFQLSDGAKKKLQRQQLLDGLLVQKVRLISFLFAQDL